MSLVTILLTHPDADEFEPFELDGTTYRFGKIGASGAQKQNDGPIWIFVDWVLEDMSGLELCRRLRADPHTASAHITIVLDENDTVSRKRSLNAGADDYMIAPITRHAALDRILASGSAVRSNASAKRREYGPLVINVQGYRAYWNDDPIETTPNEFRLLRLLAENANNTLSRRIIVEHLVQDEETLHERSVDVYVGRLRKAILKAGGGKPLRTVRNIGYVLDLGPDF